MWCGNRQSDTSARNSDSGSRRLANRVGRRGSRLRVCAAAIMALAPFAMTVLYGSQSGCAQDVAERIARHARLWQVPVTLSCMDDFGMVRIVDLRL